MKTLLDLRLSENDRKAVIEAVGILKGGFPVTRVLLFGSKAEGLDDPESDIDLLVLTSRELPWRERDEIINSLFDTQLKYDVVFGVLVVSEDEWGDGLTTVLPIHHEIEEHGVLV
jgi:predicted nucleotidyltransferase